MMAREVQKGKRMSRLRRFWRRSRQAVLLVVLLVVAVLFYLNRIGFPEVVQERLAAAFAQRGIQFECRRLRLRFLQGLEVEALELAGGAGEQSRFQVAVRRGRLFLDWPALARGKLQPTGIRLDGGYLVVQLSTRDEEAVALAIRELGLDLQMPPGDRLVLQNLHGDFDGLPLRISGIVTHPQDLWTQWQKRSAHPRWSRSDWIDWMEAWQQLSLEQTPQLEMQFQIDGAEPRSLSLAVTAEAPGLAWRDVVVRRLRFQAQMGLGEELDDEVPLEMRLWMDRCEHARGRLLGAKVMVRGQWDIPNQRLLPVQADLQADSGRVGTVAARHLRLESMLEIAADAEGDRQWDSVWNGTAESLAWKNYHAEAFAVDGATHHTGLSPWPESFDLRFDLARANGALTGLTNASVAETTVRLEGEKMETEAATEMLPQRDWWNRITPYRLQVTADVAGVEANPLRIARLHTDLGWQAPQLEIRALNADLFDKTCRVTGRLDIDNRLMAVETAFDFDLKRIEPFFSTRVRRRLDLLEWDEPPAIEAAIQVELPAWTNRHPDWRAQIRPKAWVSGQFTCGSGSYKGVPIDAAASHFVYTNQHWRLPDLRVDRPEGELVMECNYDSRTRDYAMHCRGESYVLPWQPVFGSRSSLFLEPLEESRPARVDLMVYGPWNVGRGALDGGVVLSNFVYRGTPWNHAEGEFFYTNRVLRVENAKFVRTQGEVGVTNIVFDIDERKLVIENAVSTVQPMEVAAMIGTNALRILEPYRFGRPPRVQVAGTLITRQPIVPDLDFNVSGGPFQYWRFHLPFIRANLHWEPRELAMNDVEGQFYEGKLSGSADFQFPEPHRTVMALEARVGDVRLNPLIRDLHGGDTRLEGRFDAHAQLQSTNCLDFSTWEGNGKVDLRDGMIWDVPIFGLFSPLLNFVSPGLGNTRADRATATFRMVNGRIWSNDLFIRSPRLGLSYDGMVDLEGRIEAVATAEFFGDTALIGPLLDKALLPLTETLKYEVTGTLAHPRAKPLYLLPRVILFPFRPFKTLQELLPDQNTGGNAPRTRPPTPSP